MKWQDKTITLGELARLLREERMHNKSVGWPGSFNNGLGAIASTVSSNADLTPEEANAFLEEAGE